ncbi:sulfurtransferase complex subunit TusB [Litchfieldella xinjiangensis]|uniref:sulfurtransferase complex subunit TusB n=1 Tax=Litchfieldella xinjiangensis TaxID=1166948 RepID=UPI0005BBC6C8|nr:sulfurtransferase complex subunit TusB [Halomonas xinjiangensis]
MVLHILNRSPSMSRVFQQALDAMGTDDRLLLIEDGVQGALPQLIPYLEPVLGRLFVLKEDLVSRALEGHCDARAIVVDVDGFVSLTEEADKTVSWF